MKMAAVSSPISASQKPKRVSYDEALAETKYGKFNYFVIIVSGLMLFNVALETLGIGFALPVSECDLNLTIQEKGILSAINIAGIICSSHLWGFLADTQGRREIIRPSLLMGFAMSVASSFATSFLILVIFRFLNGIFISAASATVYAYLGEFHTNKSRNRAIMGASFICAFAGIFFPTLAWLVINQDWSFYIPYLDIVYKPWRMFIFVSGLLGLFCGLCLYKIPESPKFVLSTGDEEKTIEILRKIYAINTGKSQEEYPVIGIYPDDHVSKGEKFAMAAANNNNTNSNGNDDDVNHSNCIMHICCSMWNQTAPLFTWEYLRKTVLICILQFCIFVTGHGMYVWFPKILNDVMTFTEEYPDERCTICDIIEREQKLFLDMLNGDGDIKEKVCIEKLEFSTYLHTIVLEVLYVTFFLLMGSIMKFLGRVPVLFIIEVACGLCGIISVLVNIPIFGIYLHVIQLLCGLGVTVVSAITVDLFPTHLRAMAVCISLMFGRVGSVIGSNVAGMLLATNCQAAFFISGSALILCGILGFLLPKPPKSAALDPSNDKEISVIS